MLYYKAVGARNLGHLLKFVRADCGVWGVHRAAPHGAATGVRRTLPTATPLHTQGGILYYSMRKTRRCRRVTPDLYGPATLVHSSDGYRVYRPPHMHGRLRSERRAHAPWSHMRMPCIHHVVAAQGEHNHPRPIQHHQFGYPSTCVLPVDLLRIAYTLPE